VWRDFLRQLLDCELLVPLLLDQICGTDRQLKMILTAMASRKHGQRRTHCVLLELIPPLMLNKSLSQHLF
jgi:hypothetical protein